MASYKIEWKQSARKELKRLEKLAIPRVLKAVEALVENPHPTGSRKLRGADRTYRVRVGATGLSILLNTTGCLLRSLASATEKKYMKSLYR